MLACHVNFSPASIHVAPLLYAQTEHLRQPYQATQSYRGAQETGAPYVVRGFPSTSGSLGGGGSGGYAVGSAPVSSYGGAGGGAGGSMYGGIAGGTSVHVTPQQTPQLAPQPLARRSLTHPDTGISNDGWDNENSDLILAVGDVLVNMAGDRCSLLHLWLHFAQRHLHCTRLASPESNDSPRGRSLAGREHSCVCCVAACH